MSAPRVARRRAEVDGSRLRWPGARGAFALFAEVLWTGILVAVASLPLVTWPAAFAAGSAHLRRYLYAEASPPARFFGDVRAALPGGLAAGAATTALTAVAVIDLLLVATGALPAGLVVGVVAATAALAALVLTLTAAALYSRGDRWGELLRIAPRLLRADLAGAAYTVVAVVLAAVAVWQFLPLVIPATGMLVFALVAIGERRFVRLATLAESAFPCQDSSKESAYRASEKE